MDGIQEPHALDLALQALHQDVSIPERMEVIWEYYESTTGDRISRPPNDSQRERVHQWVMTMRQKSDDWPMFWTKRPRRRLDASLSMLEKAGSVVQLACPACTPLFGRQHRPVPVEPWSAQVSNDENQRMKQLVRDYLADRRSFGPPQAGPLCVSVVTVLPQRRNAIDADNSVKGLLDSLAGSIYENDRDIQCLTSRVIRNTNESGHYLLEITQVAAWDADVIWPNNPAPQLFA